MKRTAYHEPPQNVVLNTMSENGQKQQLIKKGNLWWFTDMSMYVYNTPAYWEVA